MLGPQVAVQSLLCVDRIVLLSYCNITLLLIERLTKTALRLYFCNIIRLVRTQLELCIFSRPQLSITCLILVTSRCLKAQ